MNEEDVKLIEAAKIDRKAFTKIYNRYYRLIRYIIYNIVKDDAMTADLVSVTFTKIFERLHYFEKQISFEAWIKTIAVNTAIDFLRASKHNQSDVSIDNEDNFIQIEDSDDDPENKIIHTESLEILKQSLPLLRYKYRNLIELRYFQNLSYKDLSKHLNVPIGTIKSDLNKAKKKLREIFQKVSKNYKS